MPIDGKHLAIGALPWENEYPVEVTFSNECLIYVASRRVKVTRVGIAVSRPIGAGAATGAISFGRRRAGTDATTYYTAAIIIPAGTAQGYERWIDIRIGTGATRLAWNASADTWRERLLNQGDAITFNMTGTPGLAGHVVPMVHIIPLQRRPTR